MSGSKHDIFVRIMNNNSDLTEDEVVEQFIKMDEFDSCHTGRSKCYECGTYQYCSLCMHCCECNNCYALWKAALEGR